MDNTVVVTTIRKNALNVPFRGKIVFTLKGSDKHTSTSFTGEFKQGYTQVQIIPNSIVSTSVLTYYSYKIYSAGHTEGTYLSEPVEEGICIVPNYSCNLDDIISIIPKDEDTANAIILEATNLLTEIREEREIVHDKMTDAIDAAKSAQQYKNTIVAYALEITENKNEIDNIKDTIDSKIGSLNSAVTSAQSSANSAQQAISTLQNTTSNALSSIDSAKNSAITSLTETLAEITPDISVIESSLNSKADIATITSLQTQLNQKANNSSVVLKTGDETITGDKVFNVLQSTSLALPNDITPSSGMVFTKTISSNTTINFSSISGSDIASCITLVLTNGGAYTITWDSSILWPEGEVPELSSSGIDVLTFFTTNSGTTWYGFVNGIGME